jgi:putative ABC transport system substrate-binding protein
LARLRHANRLIGLLGANTAAVDRPRRAAFVQRLGELGWVEGRSVMIEYRWADGLAERAGEIAAEFVRLQVDIIVAAGDAQVLATKRATADIPIVIASAGDPVGNGLVASLARPGGNVTGLSLALTDTAGKRLELLREVVPGLRRLAILGNFANPTVALELSAVEVAAHTLSLYHQVGNPTYRGCRARDRVVQRPRRSTLRLSRPARDFERRSHQRVGAGRATADHA